MTFLLLAVALFLPPNASALKAEPLLYGDGTQTNARWNPGATGVISYMNCFTAVTPGDSMIEITNAVFGIRRATGYGGLVDVGVNLYAAEMTFEGATFGRGANHLIYSTNSLGTGLANRTQLVDTGPISGVNLALELTSVPGFGGWWMGVEFTGVNAPNTLNGWRVVNTPTTGRSANGFGMFNYQNSGVFEALFSAGNPPGSSPSRLMVNVTGNLSAVPEIDPAGMGGVFALVTGALALLDRRRTRARAA